MDTSYIALLPDECKQCPAREDCYIKGTDQICMNFSKKVKEELLNESKC